MFLGFPILALRLLKRYVSRSLWRDSPGRSSLKRFGLKIVCRFDLAHRCSLDLDFYRQDLPLAHPTPKVCTCIIYIFFLFIYLYIYIYRYICTFYIFIYIYNYLYMYLYIHVFIYLSSIHLYIYIYYL